MSLRVSNSRLYLFVYSFIHLGAFIQTRTYTRSSREYPACCSSARSVSAIIFIYIYIIYQLKNDVILFIRFQLRLMSWNVRVRFCPLSRHRSENNICVVSISREAIRKPSRRKLRRPEDVGKRKVLRRDVKKQNKTKTYSFTVIKSADTDAR